MGGVGGSAHQQRGIRPRGLTTPHEPGAVQALPWLVHSLHGPVRRLRRWQDVQARARVFPLRAACLSRPWEPPACVRMAL